jgi:predicted nucleic acid-binding protein
LLFGIRALPAGKRKNMLDRALNELLELFKDRVLPFDTDAARHYADLAVTAKNGGRGFPTPDGYIAAIAASRGFIVASRDTSPYEAAGVTSSTLGRIKSKAVIRAGLHGTHRSQQKIARA